MEPTQTPKETNKPEQIKPDRTILLAEYAAANDVYIHFDSYSWTVGSVLIASVFIFWGFIINIPQSTIVNVNFVALVTSLLISLTSLWMLYADHNRQIVLSKLHRIQEIEGQFGMKQHTGWVRDEKGRIVYHTFGLKGHIIDLLIYLVTSLGTLLICMLKFGWSWSWLLPIALCVGTYFWVARNEKMINRYLARIGD